VEDDAWAAKLRSFVLGGIVGGLAGLAAGRLEARRGRTLPPAEPGLAAFERAPCYEELLEQGHRERELR